MSESVGLRRRRYNIYLQVLFRDVTKFALIKYDRLQLRIISLTAEQGTNTATLKFTGSTEHPTYLNLASPFPSPSRCCFGAQTMEHQSLCRFVVWRRVSSIPILATRECAAHVCTEQ